MTHLTATARFADVQSALQRYHNMAALEQQRARYWPAVVEAAQAGLSPATAIQQLLDQALATLEIDDPPAGQLLRGWLMRPYAQAASQPQGDERSDPAALKPSGRHAIAQLAALITQLNQASAQRLAQRFIERRPAVGLEQYADQLHRQLRDPHAPPIAVISGGEGLGKTTLARMVAARCAADEQFAGVLWSDARQIECDSWAGRRRDRTPPLNPHDLLLSLARELCIDGPNDLATLRREVRAHCALRRYVIAIDNLETAADLIALGPLIELLIGASRLLIVTRDPPRAALPTLWPYVEIRLEPLDAATSAALVRQAMTRTDGPTVAQASAAELAQLHAAVGGRPLALWLIAGQLSDQSWPCLLHELSQWRIPVDADGALYDQLYRYIWSRLSESAQMALFAMHRCEAGAERELLFELSGLDQPTFQAALDELQQRMLVSFDQRYTIHRLTYTFLRVVIAGWWSR